MFNRQISYKRFISHSYLSLLKGTFAFKGLERSEPLRYASADAEEAGRWLLRSGEATGRHRTHLHLGIQQVGWTTGLGNERARK